MSSKSSINTIAWSPSTWWLLLALRRLVSRKVRCPSLTAFTSWNSCRLPTCRGIFSFVVLHRLAGWKVRPQKASSWEAQHLTAHSLKMLSCFFVEAVLGQCMLELTEAVARHSMVRHSDVACVQEPMLRRLHATLSAPMKLDPVRPEYHRASLQWAPPSPHKLRPPKQPAAAGTATPSPASAATAGGMAASTAHSAFSVPPLGTPAAGWSAAELRASDSASMSELDLTSEPSGGSLPGGGSLSGSLRSGGNGNGGGGFSGGAFVALSTGGQISSRLLSMRSAAALLELPQVCLESLDAQECCAAAVADAACAAPQDVTPLARLARALLVLGRRFASLL